MREGANENHHLPTTGVTAAKFVQRIREIGSIFCSVGGYRPQPSVQATSGVANIEQMGSDGTRSSLNRPVTASQALTPRLDVLSGNVGGEGPEKWEIARREILLLDQAFRLLFKCAW
jgi:hypothetical protein